MTFAAEAERRAGNDRDMLLKQQPLGKLFGREAGAADRRKRIKRALRQMAVQARLIETVYNEAPALVVLADHIAHGRLAVFEGFHRRFLPGRRSAHDRVGVDLQQRGEDRRGGADIAQPPAGHGIGFREAVQKYCPVPRARQRRDARMDTVVSQSVVNLVADQIQVVLNREIYNRLQTLTRHGRAGRVRRVTQHNRPCARRPRSLKLLHRHPELVLHRRQNADGNAAGQTDARLVRHIARLRDQDFVAGV